MLHALDAASQHHRHGRVNRGRLCHSTPQPTVEVPPLRRRPRTLAPRHHDVTPEPHAPTPHQGRKQATQAPSPWRDPSPKQSAADVVDVQHCNIRRGGEGRPRAACLSLPHLQHDPVSSTAGTATRPATGTAARPAATPGHCTGRTRRSVPGDTGSACQGGGSNAPWSTVDEASVAVTAAPPRSSYRCRGRSSPPPPSSSVTTSPPAATVRGAAALADQHSFPRGNARGRHPGGRTRAPGGPSPVAARLWRVGRG
jgi:hypothetical protein